MANLLPQDKKKDVRKEYCFRVLVVSLFMFGVAFLVDIVLMSSLYILLCSRLSGLDQMYAVAAEEQENMTKLERSIDDARAKLELLKHDNSSIKIPYGVFRSIVDIKPNNIFLTKFAYANDQISVTGFAPLRNDLQDFIVAIGKHDTFSQVDYPFSNITQKEDIDFSLIINFAKDNEE